MHNTGIRLAGRSRDDFIYMTPLAAPLVRSIDDWAPFMPKQELQYGYQNCVTFSGDHSIEAQVNADIARGKYSKEALDYFEEAGYMEDGKFRVSERYNSKMNGTTQEGQYMNVAGDGWHNPRLVQPLTMGHGLLPNKDWPLVQGMSWAQYYAPIPAELIEKAKKIYRYLEVYWNWVDVRHIPKAVKNSPVQVAVAICDGWSGSSTVKACSGPMQHCVTVYGIDSAGNYEIMDQLAPCMKKLSRDYKIFAAIQFVVRPTMPPTAWEKFWNLVTLKKI